MIFKSMVIKSFLTIIYLSQDILSDPIPATLGIENIITKTCERKSTPGDELKMHYRGRLAATGVEFDSSFKRNTPFKFVFGAGQVIRGWDEGLLDMCPGDKRVLTIPPSFGYGSRGVGGVIPGDATLIFDVELVDIVKKTGRREF